jgi:glycogen operon protein
MLNGTPETKHFVMPSVTRGIRWRLFMDTSKESPKDVYPNYDGPYAPANRQLDMIYRSSIVWIGDE